MMRITKGDKTINIPGWALFVGALVVEHKLANSVEEQGHPDLAHRSRNMAEDEYRHS